MKWVAEWRLRRSWESACSRSAVPHTKSLSATELFQYLTTNGLDDITANFCLAILRPPVTFTNLTHLLDILSDSVVGPDERLRGLLRLRQSQLTDSSQGITLPDLVCIVQETIRDVEPEEQTISAITSLIKMALVDANNKDPEDTVLTSKQLKDIQHVLVASCVILVLLHRNLYDLPSKCNTSTATETTPLLSRSDVFSNADIQKLKATYTQLLQEVHRAETSPPDQSSSFNNHQPSTVFVSESSSVLYNQPEVNTKVEYADVFCKYFCEGGNALCCRLFRSMQDTSEVISYQSFERVLSQLHSADRTTQLCAAMELWSCTEKQPHQSHSLELYKWLYMIGELSNCGEVYQSVYTPLFTVLFTLVAEPTDSTEIHLADISVEQMEAFLCRLRRWLPFLKAIIHWFTPKTQQPKIRSSYNPRNVFVVLLFFGIIIQSMAGLFMQTGVAATLPIIQQQWGLTDAGYGMLAAAFPEGALISLFIAPMVYMVLGQYIGAPVIALTLVPCSVLWLFILANKGPLSLAVVAVLLFGIIELTLEVFLFGGLVRAFPDHTVLSMAFSTIFSSLIRVFCTTLMAWVAETNIMLFGWLVLVASCVVAIDATVVGIALKFRNRQTEKTSSNSNRATTSATTTTLGCTLHTVMNKMNIQLDTDNTLNTWKHNLARIPTRSWWLVGCGFATGISNALMWNLSTQTMMATELLTYHQATLETTTIFSFLQMLCTLIIAALLTFGSATTILLCAFGIIVLMCIGFSVSSTLYIPPVVLSVGMAVGITTPQVLLYSFVTTGAPKPAIGLLFAFLNGSCGIGNIIGAQLPRWILNVRTVSGYGSTWGVCAVIVCSLGVTCAYMARRCDRHESTSKGGISIDSPDSVLVSLLPLTTDGGNYDSYVKKLVKMPSILSQIGAVSDLPNVTKTERETVLGLFAYHKRMVHLSKRWVQDSAFEHSASLAVAFGSDDEHSSEEGGMQGHYSGLADDDFVRTRTV